MLARSGPGLSRAHQQVFSGIRFACMAALAAAVIASSAPGLAQNGTVFPRTSAVDLIAPPPSTTTSTKKTTRRSSNLSADPDAGPLSGQGYLQVIRLGPGGALSLREGPGTEYLRLTILSGDAVGLRPLDAFGRWTRVHYCGFEGWVAASFTAPMADGQSPLHECSKVGPLGLNSDPAAVGSGTRLALAPLAAGLTAGLGQGFTESELTKIARDDYDLPIRETSTGRRLGQAPSKDPYLDCIYEAEQERENEIVCVQAALRSWQTAMGEALERHRQLTQSNIRDIERSQSAWRAYAQGTCDDFALADAPPVLKSHRATCQLMFTRERTLELEQLLVQRDSDCRLCKRELVEAPAPEDSAAADGATEGAVPPTSLARETTQESAQESTPGADLEQTSN